MSEANGIDRVLEVGSYAAGYCGRLFAQNGHDVVQVITGEPEPAWVSQRSMNTYLHADKRRVATNNKNLIQELAQNCDVAVLEAPTAEAIDEYGFDDWTCPVKVAITPFGRTGPQRNWLATSSTLLAMGGQTNLMGDPDREPLTMPGHFVDFQSGGLAYSATMAARFARQESAIDIGKLEVVMTLSQFTTVLWTCAKVVRSRHANDFWTVVPSNLFRCVDGWIYMNIVPHFWDPFTTFLDLPELLLDDRFATNGGRMKHRDELHKIIADVLINWSRREIMRRAEDNRIPLGAVLSFGEVLSDPHLKARYLWQQVKGPQETHEVTSPGLAWRIHGEPRRDSLLHDVEVL